MAETNWDIRRKGRAWKGTEARRRFSLTPERFEMFDGKLFWADEQRLTMLALLLENVGIDQAVRLGNPQLWKAAVACLDTPADR